MNRPKMILLTGTLDVGKTTLLNEFADNPQITVIREVAQDLIDLHGYEITQVPEFQDMVFAEQIAREEAGIAQGRQFVLCDRGTVDIIGFSQIIGVPIKDEWRKSLNRYDAVTIFNKDDINFQPELYDVPFDMIEYRAQVDKSIRSVLSEIGITPLEIAGHHEMRLQQFRELLEGFKLMEGAHLSSEGNSFRRGKEY